MADFSTVVVTQTTQAVVLNTVTQVVQVNSSVPGSYDSVGRLGLGVFDVKEYGALGDGATDDTTAIGLARAALVALGGGVLWFHPGKTYMINADYANGKSVRLADNMIVELNGAELKAITNSLTAYAVVYGSAVSNVRIRGGKVTGERTTHTGSTGESGMGVHLLGVNRFWVEDVYASNCWGDGIYVGSSAGPVPCQAGHVTGCEMYNNRRNNMSITGLKQGEVSGCLFRSANGTAPQAGLDIEPNNSGDVQDVTVSDCWGIDNTGTGFSITGAAPQNTKLVNAHVRRCGIAGILVGGTAQDTTIDNCDIAEITTATRGVLDVGSGVVRTAVRGGRIYNVETGQSAVYLHSAATGVTVKGVDIEKLNTVSAANVAINVNAPKTIVEGCTFTNTNGIGLSTTSGAADCQFIGNKGLTNVGRGFYIDSPRCLLMGNSVEDTTTISGGLYQFATNATGTIAIGNKARLSTPDTSKVAFRFDVAPAYAVGNTQAGCQPFAAGYVGIQVSADRGDASITLVADVDEYEQRFDTVLTGNKTITLSSANAYAGCRFKIVRTGLGAFTLNVGGLKTIPSATAAVVEVTHNGAAWKLSGYQLL